jgi:pyruvate dehydrogenase (quinone)
MAVSVGDFFIDRLHQWGVRRIYGYPGDGINGVFGALQRAEGKIEFVQVRHEEMAAFMASAHAKFTGELGVCIATSGPGAAHLITGLYDARLDHMPVLANTGQQARMALGGHYQQEVDLTAMFKDVASAFVQTVTVPAQVRHMTDRAVRIATARRRVTAMVFPNDLQELEYEEPPRAHGTLHSGIGYNPPKVVPYDQELCKAADVLNRGKKVAILVADLNARGGKWLCSAKLDLLTTTKRRRSRTGGDKLYSPGWQVPLNAALNFPLPQERPALSTAWHVHVRFAEDASNSFHI